MPGKGRCALRATGWLRVALVAGLAGSVAALVFDLLVAEGVIDRAIAAEEGRSHTHALGVPEPFSRTGQRGGLVAGELMLGLGFGLLLAGALTFLTPLASSARRLWLLVVGTAVWAIVVVPNAAYPPLPPGVESALPVGDRQLLWLAAAAVGLAAFAASAWAWSDGRRAAAVALLVVPTVLAALLLPDQRAAATDGSLLLEFRAAAVVSQILFWSVLAAAGFRLLGRREAPATAVTAPTGFSRSPPPPPVRRS
jgi:predicted cobalt transporter CbtA